MNNANKHKIRIVTAASLFDGHDASINIMRRILQAQGAEIIHLGHNRTAQEIVSCAIEEDAQAIAVTSYQGGHIEFFSYMRDLLVENGYGHIKIFGGGGGTILPEEIEQLHAYGITKIYSPDDGRRLGLEGMIKELITLSDFEVEDKGDFSKLFTLGGPIDVRNVARAITRLENKDSYEMNTKASTAQIPVLGITGTGGAGKSSITDEIVRRYLYLYPSKTIAVISVDPSKKKTGGALLGDRIRMNAIAHPRAYMRSMATRSENVALSKHVSGAIDICKSAGYDFIILESAGVGQSDASIIDYCSVSMYAMTPEYGAASQLEKINMIDYADIICMNKFDKSGAKDALHDVRKQYKRSHQLWDAADETLPVVGTIAAQFNDPGIHKLVDLIFETVAAKTGIVFTPTASVNTVSEALKKVAQQAPIIPANKVRYLAEIAASNRSYDAWVLEQVALATKLYQLNGTLEILGTHTNDTAISEVAKAKEKVVAALDPSCKTLIENWPSVVEKYSADFFFLYHQG